MGRFYLRVFGRGVRGKDRLVFDGVYERERFRELDLIVVLVGFFRFFR